MKVPATLQRALVGMRVQVLDCVPLYAAYKWMRGEQDRLCTASTDFCVDGFESSANTFIYRALELIRPDLQIAHHTHVVANLKRADRYQVPLAILFRDPAECIPSVVSRFRPSLDEAVLRYLRFYRYILEDLRTDLLLVSFEDATQRPEESLTRILAHAGFDAPPESMDDIEARTKEEIVRRTQEDDNMQVISLPREQREYKKSRVRTELFKHPRYTELTSLYEKLNRAYQHQNA